MTVMFIYYLKKFKWHLIIHDLFGGTLFISFVNIFKRHIKAEAVSQSIGRYRQQILFKIWTEVRGKPYDCIVVQDLNFIFL